MASQRMNNTFFISHGTPMMLVDDTILARHFLKSWKDVVLTTPPSAILIVSAHWDTQFPTVNAVSCNETIYDFPHPNFPEATYKFEYPAPGSPELAKKVKKLLLESGYEHVDEDGERGLDHGAWIPLLFMYPEADVPVCQLSIQTHRDGTYHYNLGRALAPLKDKGVLIVGAGGTTHSHRDVSRGDSIPTWAMEFDSWVKDALLEGRYEDINHYEKAPGAKLAHPTPEHFYPLLVALGAAGDNAVAKQIHHSWTKENLSKASYQFTTPATSKC